MIDSDVEVLICSCDRYSDVWNAFFTLFFRYWPDCPYKIKLIANHEKYPDPRVTTIATDPNSDWSSAFLFALSTIKSKYVIVIIEDFLFTTPVNTDTIRKIVSYMDSAAVNCMHLYPVKKAGSAVTAIDGFDLCDVPPGTPFRINLQTAIWQKAYAEKIAQKGESAWSFEICGTQRSFQSPAVILSVNCEPDKAPIPYYCTGVGRGVWMPGAVRLCKKEGITLDFTKRKVGWIRGLFRDCLILQPVRYAFVFIKRLRGMH